MCRPPSAPRRLGDQSSNGAARQRLRLRGGCRGPARRRPAGLLRGRRGRRGHAARERRGLRALDAPAARARRRRRPHDADDRARPEISMPVLVAPVAFQRARTPGRRGRDGARRARRRARSCASRRSRPRRRRRSPRRARRAGSSSTCLRDRACTRELIEQARAAGLRGARRSRSTRRCSAAASATSAPAFTIPPELAGRRRSAAATSRRRARFGSISPSLTWSDVERLAARGGLPVLAQGRAHGRGRAARMRARRRRDRRLEPRRPAARRRAGDDRRAARGRRGRRRPVEVLLDGGIRRGTDVVKALALGARAVLVGRAPLWGLAVDGEAGVRARARAAPRRDRAARCSSSAAARRPTSRPRTSRAPFAEPPASTLASR